MGRLVTFMSRLQADFDLTEVKGIGVDERTAVLVSPDGSSVTHGEGAAHFVRAYQKPTKISPGEPLSHRSLESWAVSDEQSFDLSTWSSEDVEPQAITVSEGILNP